MSTIRCLIVFLFSLLFNNALGDGAADPWVEGKIQELENAIQRGGCQQYLAHGYKYEHMYDIDGVAFDNVVVRREDGQLKDFEMHMAIKSEKDGIILLSPKAWPGANDLVFEIGIGIGRNLFSVIRIKKDSSDEVIRVPTPDILSAKQYKKLYIIISNDVLTIGVEGEAPFMTYSDVRMRAIKYFDVSSWGSIDGKFLYDCPLPVVD